MQLLFVLKNQTRMMGLFFVHQGMHGKMVDLIIEGTGQKTGPGGLLAFIKRPLPCATDGSCFSSSTGKVLQPLVVARAVFAPVLKVVGGVMGRKSDKRFLRCGNLRRPSLEVPQSQSVRVTDGDPGDQRLAVDRVDQGLEGQEVQYIIGDNDQGM